MFMYIHVYVCNEAIHNCTMAVLTKFLSCQGTRSKFADNNTVAKGVWRSFVIGYITFV